MDDNEPIQPENPTDDGQTKFQTQMPTGPTPTPPPSYIRKLQSDSQAGNPPQPQRVSQNSVPQQPSAQPQQPSNPAPAQPQYPGQQQPINSSQPQPQYQPPQQTAPVTPQTSAQQPQQPHSQAPQQPNAQPMQQNGTVPPQSVPQYRQQQSQYSQQPNQYQQQMAPVTPAPNMPQGVQPHATSDKGGLKPWKVVVIIIAVVALVGCIIAFAFSSLVDDSDDTVSETPATENNDDQGQEDSTTTTSDDPAADDGELHDAYNPDCGYSYTEESYRSNSSGEVIPTYGASFDTSFDVRYPQLSGDNPNIDAINTAIRNEAMTFVNATYLAPDANSLYYVLVQSTLESSAGDNFDLLIEDTVDYAITYNDENIISICMSSHYLAGSVMSEFVELRTVNANLETGEIYTFDNSLNMTDSMAQEWIDNMNEYNSFTVNVYGESGTRDVLMGNTNEKFRAVPVMFIDGNGKVNVGVTYWFSNNGNISRGWWDVTPTDSTLEQAKKDPNSSLWKLVS